MTRVNMAKQDTQGYSMTGVNMGKHDVQGYTRYTV